MRRSAHALSHSSTLTRYNGKRKKQNRIHLSETLEPLSIVSACVCVCVYASKRKPKSTQRSFHSQNYILIRFQLSIVVNCARYTKWIQMEKKRNELECLAKLNDMESFSLSRSLSLCHSLPFGVHRQQVQLNIRWWLSSAIRSTAHNSNKFFISSWKHELKYFHSFITLNRRETKKTDRERETENRIIEIISVRNVRFRASIESYLKKWTKMYTRMREC